MNTNQKNTLRVASYTLGCKLNQAETESLVAAFKKEGFESVPFSEEADIAIVNTCTVTSKSEQKGRRSIRNCAKHYPDVPLIVTGCYAQLEPEAIKSLAPNVFVVSSIDKARIAGLPKALIFAREEGVSFSDAVSEYLSGGFLDSGIEFSPFIYTPSHLSTRSRAFLKIQDGCDFNCSFCRVSPARGDSISLPFDQVVERLRTAIKEGFHEVVLTGVNICCYRSEDLKWGTFIEKLGEYSEFDSLRIRLSSINPDFLTSKSIKSLASKGIMPHFHLAIQAGSDDVLKRMRRRHTFQGVVDAVAGLRRIKDDPFIASDIIVGFPGESEADFEKTIELMHIVKPAHLHIFPYSERPGTEAFNFKNKVPQRIAKERIGRLTAVSEKYNLEYLKRWENRELEILIEEKKGEFSGTSRHYIQGVIEQGSLPKEKLIAGELRIATFKLKEGKPLFSVK